MTREHVSSFVSDLVTMAQAMERLPEVQAELESALNVVGTQADAIQRLELRIIDLKNISDTHLATIRTLEASRDDAELRFLEADERTTQALAFVRTVFGNAGSLIQALDPPRVAEPKSSEPQPTGQSGSDPIGAPSQSSDGAKASDAGSGEPMPATQEPVSVQADPTTADAPVDATSTTASHTDPVASTVAEPTPPGPYSGRRYIDVPHYVSLDNWTAGGGTEADYYASRRPNLAV